jgi:hypothetical protein
VSKRQQAAEKAAEAAMQASEAGRVLRAQREEKAPEPEAPQVEGERPPARNEPRQRGMEEIERRDLQNKGLDTPKEEEAKPEVPDPTPLTPEQILAANQESQPAPAPVVEEVVPETVTVKIFGEERQVPKEEVEEYGGIKAYQIAKAAEVQLREAKEAQAEARRERENLMRHLQQQMQPKEPIKTPAQIVQEKIDLIRFGTPEESAAALQEVLEKSQTKIDPNHLLHQAVQLFNEQTAFAKFKSDFPEIASNPELEKFATMLGREQALEIYKLGKTPEWSKFYTDLGQKVRSVIGYKPNQPAPIATTTGQTSPGSSEKEARKASIVTLPTAAARAKQPEEPQPPTRAEIFSEMRRGRGQHTG